MPIYVYKCVESGETFEYRQKMSDEPLKYWPKDVDGYKPKRKVKRIIGGGNYFNLKGKGFYENDY